MSTESTLADYIDSHLEELAGALFNQLADMPGTPYKKQDQAKFLTPMQGPFKASSAYLRGKPDELRTFSRETIRQRAKTGLLRGEAVGQIGDAIYGELLKLVPRLFPDDTATQAEARALLAELTLAANKASYDGYLDVREQNLNQRESELQELQGAMEQVSHTLRELSSPIAPIHDNVLVLPLVGEIDPNRTQNIMEDLLENIVSRQSDYVIIDITGVPVVDGDVANALLQTTRAVNLLGARVILVGISAEVAQTIVGLDLDLGQLTVRANLQDGIEFALAQLGLGIRPLPAEDLGDEA
ncbi:MAG TPA: STAS domain-containing protein [Herpetosiphonaceae bacterium]